MEARKTKAADLEGKRTTRFLLGLILVLATLFVALEHTDGDKRADDDDSFVDDLPNDIDLTPSTTQKDMIPLVAKRHKAEEAARIKVVDDNSVAEDVPPVADTGDKEGTDDDGQAKGGDDKGTDTDSQTGAMSPVATDANDNPLNFHVVEDLPQFPGGAVEMMKWLTKNLRYPSAAQQQKVQGKVVVQFIINRDGSISSIKLVKKLHPACDNEALRVVRMMPKWKPGVQHDKPCRTMVCIPIVFKL